MRLVSYTIGDQAGFGAVTADGVVDLGRATGRNGGLIDALRALGASGLASAARGRAADHALSSVALEAPVSLASKIICVRLNYRSHIEEMGREIPKYPTLFVRFPESLVGGGRQLVCPKESASFDFEGELAFVIGKDGRRIDRDRALDHVAGYTCFNDGTIREYQRHTSQFTAGKNFWRSGSIGPWITTADEIPNPATLALETRLNGQVMQSTTTADLVFGVADLVAYISSIMPLRVGDIVATGTTGGVGAARTPPRWMKPGDTVEVEIERIGVLRNPVVADA